MRIYISGPMSGYPELNFPAFAEAAKRLRELGHIVISPHEVKQTATDWESCMKADIKQMMDADAVVTLNGWEHSKGACIEVALGKNLRMQVFHIDILLKMEVSA